MWKEHSHLKLTHVYSGYTLQERNYSSVSNSAWRGNADKKQIYNQLTINIFEGKKIRKVTDVLLQLFLWPCKRVHRLNSVWGSFLLILYPAYFSSLKVTHTDSSVKLSALSITHNYKSLIYRQKQFGRMIIKTSNRWDFGLFCNNTSNMKRDTKSSLRQIHKESSELWNSLTENHWHTRGTFCCSEAFS